MDFLVKGAESFIGLFQLGANTFMSWMTGQSVLWGIFGRLMVKVSQNIAS